MGLLSIQPTYAPTNATYIPPATEVELRRDRLKCGQCPDCGLQTHDFVKKGLFGFGGTISVPLTNGNVTSGRCLKCKPLDLPAVPHMASFVPAQYGDDSSMPAEDADDATPVITSNQIIVPSAPLENHSKIIVPDLDPNNNLTTSDNIKPDSDKYCFAIVGKQFTVARRNAKYGVCALTSMIIIALIVGFSVYAVGNEKDPNQTTEPITTSMSMDHEPTLTPSSPTQDKTSPIASFPETSMSPFDPPTTKPLMPSTLSTQMTTMSREKLIREAIEKNVLQRNVKFDQLPQNDNRILALNWLLDDDQMKLDPTDSNLNQRYILALLSFEWGQIPNLIFGSIPENAKDSVEWLSDENECKWWLVACNDDGQVRVLHLDASLETALYLEGTLPPEIGRLSQLTNLDLQSNALSGTLPSEIENLNELTVLFLGSNQFKGTVPSEFGNLKELIYLDLGFNMLTGILPSELGNLNKLTTLNVEGNQFTGTFPWNETSKMTKLCLNFYNSFTGVVPAEIDCV